jgi:cobalt-zinc-cadmium efflux system protein
MFTDTAGIALALFAIWVAGRAPSEKRTFGYQRAEILAAAFNALILLGLSGFILVEAIRRLMAPPEVQSGVMIVFGIIGLIGNVVALFLLRSGQKESLNVHGAFLEVLSDFLGSIAVIVAAGVIMLTGWHQADAIASLVIGVLIIPRTFKLLRDSLDVLLEATPRHINLAEVRKHILEIPGVSDAHDLHAWLITSGVPVLSAHIVVSDPTERNILHKLQDCVKEHFDIAHSTFQIETTQHKEHEHGVHQ